MRSTRAGKRVWAILVLCCLALSFASSACAQPAKAIGAAKSVAWLTKKSTKIYKKKSMESDVVGTIPSGSAVSVIRTSGSWFKVSYGGVSGYAKKIRFKKVDTEETGDGESKVETVRLVYDLDKLKIQGGNGENVDGVDNSGLTQLDKSKNRISNWSGKIVIGEGGMAIPQLFQYDYMQTVCVYNGVARSVATSGCGATSLSMVISYLTGNTEQSPYTLFREACQDKMYSGDGLGHSALSKLAKRYDVNGEWKNLDAKELKQLLKSGTPVIAHMGIGYFTKNGHYIVLRGVTQEGKILVNDPASAERSTKAYPVELFMEEKRKGHSFMVMTKLETKGDDKDPATTYIVPAVVSNEAAVEETIVILDGQVTPEVTE